MKVEVEIEDTWLEKDGLQVTGMSATCSRCNHMVEVVGSDSPELRRALITRLHLTCRLREQNRYVIPQIIIR